MTCILFLISRSFCYDSHSFPLSHATTTLKLISQWTKAMPFFFSFTLCVFHIVSVSFHQLQRSVSLHFISSQITVAALRGKNWKKHQTSNTTSINFELFLTLLIAITYGIRLLYFLLFSFYVVTPTCLFFRFFSLFPRCGLDFFLYRFFFFVRIVVYSSYIHQCSGMWKSQQESPYHKWWT